MDTWKENASLCYGSLFAYKKITQYETHLCLCEKIRGMSMKPIA